MADTNPTEILPILIGLAEDVGNIKATSLATLEQARKTNGRVNTLEEWRGAIEQSLATAAGVERGSNQEIASIERKRDRVWNRSIGTVGVVAMLLGGGIVGDVGHHIGWW